MAVRDETLQVDGVHCMQCVQRIGTALGAVDGLLAASATLTGEVAIRYDAAEPEVRTRVVEALAGVGFAVAAAR